MEKTNALFAFALAALLIFSFGCAQQPMPGSDRDSHGCIGSAGYTWCAEKSKCLRSWEENCTSSAQQPALGSDRDEHGCIGSAGYQWCAALSKCIRPWETTCSAESEVRVLTENFPPFNFEGNNGTVDGRSSEIVRLILSKMGQHAKIEILNWPVAYQLALTEPNVALYSAARSPQREELFKWVGPIGTYDKTLYKKNGSEAKIASLEDAKKAASICVVQNDDRQQMLSGLGFSNLILKAKDAECLLALSMGEAALWFGSADTAPYVALEAGVGRDVAVPALQVEKSELYIVFSKGTPDAIVQKWQSALDGMKRDGMYDTMMVWWGSEITPGSDIDAHGCIDRAGYQWCAALSKCIRPWETICPEQPEANGTKNGASQQMAGGDRDEHGCIGSAGYSWCPELSKCVRTWETPCPSLTQKALEAQAKTYCAQGNSVYTCGEYIKVVSDMPGAGSRFYKLGDYGEPITCPVISPEYMTPACRHLLLANNCVEQKVDCGTSYPPAAVKDLKDDPSFVGAQLSWSKPDANAVDYAVYRGNEALTTISRLTTTGQTSYEDVFDGGNATYAYFVHARNADGKESPSSNVVYVRQLSAAQQPSPGQIN